MADLSYICMLLFLFVKGWKGDFSNKIFNFQEGRQISLRIRKPLRDCGPLSFHPNLEAEFMKPFVGAMRNLPKGLDVFFPTYIRCV